MVTLELPAGTGEARHAGEERPHALTGGVGLRLGEHEIPPRTGDSVRAIR